MREKQAAYNRYEYWLASLVSLSGRKKIYLRTLFMEAEGLYRARPETLERICALTKRERKVIQMAQGRSEDELESQLEYCIQNQIHLAVWGQEDYPARLEHIYNPPYALFYRGNCPHSTQRSIGVVGARNCTHYGRTVAEQIGKGLALAGVRVISGMAAGIDGAAQRGALLGQGGTCAVLGCGVDICYPAGNRKLYEQLAKEGCIVSEYPPHTQPLALNFPQRNRIISGLSDGVLVVEAREKSGSLITADFALEQGKEIYAVPGRISDLSSRGTNHLIRQGAGIFLNMEDFLKEMHIFTKTEENSSTKKKIVLENSERLVYSCLDLTPRNLEELLSETGLSLGVLMKVLETLREMGIVSEVYKNYYVRSRISIEGKNSS